MKYQAFTDATGIVLFSIVLADDAEPLEIEGLFGLSPDVNDLSAGDDLNETTPEEPRHERAQRHLSHLRDRAQADDAKPPKGGRREAIKG
jgi:hypothetical protein